MIKLAAVFAAFIASTAGAVASGARPASASRFGTPITSRELQRLQVFESLMPSRSPAASACDACATLTGGPSGAPDQS